MEGTTIFLFLSILFSVLIATSTAIDTISANHTFKDGGNGVIESAGGVFQLGFFNSGNSSNRYLGIWYKKISNTILWVANREIPLHDTSGELKIDANGVLVLIDGANSIIWSSNSSKSVRNPVAQLSDDGNLVIKYENDTDPDNILWQSFDHPGNTILSGMKVGLDSANGIEKYQTSWKSANDPSPGNFTNRLNTEGFPQLIVSRNTDVQFRFGPWDGVEFSGTAFSTPTPNIVEVTVADNQNEIYAMFRVTNTSTYMRLLLNLDGNLQLLTWIDQTESWESILTTQNNECDQYGFCGPNGNCNFTRSQLGFGACGCLEGFEPISPKKWKLGDWSDGCVRRTKLDCGNGDRFNKLPGLKLPDTRHASYNETMTLDDCRKACLKNCSCTAYSNVDIREGGIGCILWLDDLIDIRDYRPNGADLYVRVAAAEYEPKRSSRASRQVRIIVTVILVVLAVLLGLFLMLVFRKKILRRRGTLTSNPDSDATNNNNNNKDLELPLFDFPTIANATNNFSMYNKLGEGGFGPVYKGFLDEGQEIAVKRLSKDSRQGLDEFKNEVSFVAKLQHRNLVRLLGCCIEEGEMMLIYEYMPNKSLDSLVFEKEQSMPLDWPQRYNIINGIARGLLYLHQDSRLRIIHRDLKASNVLLDYDMNPKISDFGMARSFRGNQSQANTTRVVGTFGYMSPEYALDGIFSVKSDVYSFGVLMLEIISGTKMRGFYDVDPNLNLLGHAWRLFKGDKYMELIDEAIMESCNPFEVFRAIQIGLLCVQPYPEDRPNMSLVVLMLSSQIELPQPKQPVFLTERKLQESDSSSCKLVESFSSKLSITSFGPR